MKLGFIGTGNIVSDVVIGICKSRIPFKKIIVSPRNKQKALKLKNKFKIKMIIFYNLIFRKLLYFYNVLYIFDPSLLYFSLLYY